MKHESIVSLEEFKKKFAPAININQRHLNILSYSDIALQF